MFLRKVIEGLFLLFRAAMEAFSFVLNFRSEARSVLSWPVLNRSGLPWEVSALYGNFETASMLRISLVAEFGKLILIL